jgi:hypothetical protein
LISPDGYLEKGLVDTRRRIKTFGGEKGIEGLLTPHVGDVLLAKLHVLHSFALAGCQENTRRRRRETKEKRERRAKRREEEGRWRRYRTSKSK